MWQLLLDGELSTAPLNTSDAVLDLGCGSAVWTSAVAKAHPDVQVIGVDITPPKDIFKLQNLALLKGDIEGPWSEFLRYPDQLFDLIALRVLVSAIQD